MGRNCSVSSFPKYVTVLRQFENHPHPQSITRREREGKRLFCAQGLLRVAMVLFATLVFAPSQSCAQVVHERLSDWLLAHPPASGDYPLGLSWRVPGEVAAQNKLRSDLLQSLSGLDPEVKADPQALRRLRGWITTLPATGRVPMSVADARWLQANPGRDPVLQPDHDVILPRRPRMVTVVTSMGKRCAVKHAPGHEVMDYLKACEPGGSQNIDWAWVVQPDGKMQRFGVASWNLEVQGEPAPGAWIWAPPRDGGWPEHLSHQLIAFLATQGPAPDTESMAVVDDQSGAALPPVAAVRSRSMKVTSGDWGSVGLLQSPTARMREEGDFTFHLSRAYPNTYINVFLQPLDWMEVGFRYTSISNRLYGPTIAGGQAYKDKSIDAKFRLLDESACLPQVAIGLRDITGTGLFSGEYLVANKRSNNLDWSLGMGWGYLGARGNLRNPLGRINPAFDTRNAVVVGQGGNFSFSNYFRGPTALFGGVQYQTPWEPLILKLEYEGNNYQHQPQNNNLEQSSPWNFGAVYQVARSVDVSFGIERGNTAMLGVTLHTSLGEMSVPKLSDPARVAVVANRPQQSPDWVATSHDIKQQANWPVRSIEQDGHDLRVAVDDADAGYWRERLDRTLSVLHRDAPASVDRFTLAYRKHGMDVAEHRVDRDAWVGQRTQALPPGEQREAVIARAPTRAEPENTLYKGTRPALEANLGMNLAYSLGGPDGFILFQVAATEKAKLRLGDNTWLQGGLQLGLVDNYNKFRYTAPSNLPRVRTYMREYRTTSNLTMPNLQLTHTGKLGENHFFSVYGGYLEDMFAGAGGEWLYRPFERRWALGVDVNAVQQRDFRQDFGLRDYRVATGHATLYWDTGWNNVQANVSAGRYLAKDAGMTVQVSRYFQNGVSVGAGISKTNVSAVQFGEGSMDKWIYIKIPFDAMLTRSSGTDANFVWKPLTRDGGAKLDRAVTLYDTTKARDRRTLLYKPAPPPDEASIPADRRESWNLPPKGIEPYTRVTQKATAQQWLSDKQHYEQRLLEALYRQQFRNIDIGFDGSHRLSVSLSNDRIHPVSHAVGRAVRTALLNAPLDTREIRITFAETYPVVVYDFIDLPRLQRYLDGEIKQSELEDSVSVKYLDPAARQDDPLALLADTEPVVDKQNLVDTLTPDMRPAYRVKNDMLSAASHAANVNWLRAGAMGAGLVLASSALDKRADRFAVNHAQSRWLKDGNNIGNVLLPLAAFTGAAVAALDGSNPVRSRTGYAALEAGGTALLLGAGIKHVTGRARPQTGLGNNNFKPFSGSSKDDTDGFPSGHTMIVWSMLTPFAEEYRAPWLYGAAAMTNLARVGSRKHWVSDTVAGSLLGYGIGKIFWESSRAPVGKYPRLGVNGQVLTLTWNTP